MIQVDQITKTYGDITAVDQVSFNIENGEIVGLLGPNGAGKTTALRILTGYLHPDDGSVEVSGFDTREDLISAQEQIGYLPEFAPLYEDMVLQDYLEFIAGCRNIPDAEWDDRIQETAEKCDIKEQLQRRIEYLSKGYKQRVGLAQALLHDPEYLILDEPTTGLDPNQILDFRNVIQEVGEEHTVLLSTHILQEVTALCNRIIIIHNGRIVADGSEEELRNTHGENALRVGIRSENGSPDWESVQGQLQDLSGVDSVSSGEGSEPDLRQFYLNLGRQDPSDSGEEVFRLASDLGWRVTEISSETPSLETVFAKLTEPE
jgi:ABC-2 type transport system ATP-binding protein